MNIQKHIHRLANPKSFLLISAMAAFLLSSCKLPNISENDETEDLPPAVTDDSPVIPSPGNDVKQSTTLPDNVINPATSQMFSLDDWSKDVELGSSYQINAMYKEYGEQMVAAPWLEEGQSCPDFKAFDSKIHDYPTYYDVPSDKYPTIASAVVAADPGGVIRLKGGDSAFSEHIEISGKFLMIVGHPDMKEMPVWKAKTFSTPLIRTSCGGYFIISDIRFEDVSVAIRVNAIPANQQGNIIHSCEFFNVNTAVQSLGQMDFVKNDVKAINTAFDARLFSGKVTGNTFGGGEGLAIQAGGAFAANIDSNYIQNGYKGGGILIRGTGAQIRGNVLDMKKEGFGISVAPDSKSKQPFFYRIENNKVLNAGYAGISVYGSGDQDSVVLYKNTVEGTRAISECSYDFSETLKASAGDSLPILAEGFLISNTRINSFQDETANNSRSGFFINNSCGSIYGAFSAKNIFGIATQGSADCGKVDLFKSCYELGGVDFGSDTVKLVYPPYAGLRQAFCPLINAEVADSINYFFENITNQANSGGGLSVPAAPSI